MRLKIIVTSLFVTDQQQALEFYTEKLGFVKKEDVPAGEFRWITLVSPEDENGVELVLEPTNNDIASDYQQRLFEAGIPATMFGVDNLLETYANLTAQGVHFTMPPTEAGFVTIAVLDDTCGNLIQLVQG